MLLHGAGPCIFDTPRAKSNRKQETETRFPLFRDIGLHNVPGDIHSEEPGANGDVAAIYVVAVYVKKIVDNVSANGYTNKACAWMHCFACLRAENILHFRKR